MAKLPSISTFTLIWLFTLVNAQKKPNNDSGQPAQKIGNGFSPASPLFVRALDPRQTYKCADEGFYPCSHLRGCCQIGWNCCPAECCPSGTRCCEEGGCIYPGGECCGDGFSCPPGSTCYRSGGYWRCRPRCEEVTTITKTVTRTRTRETTTVTTTASEEAPSGFSCAPMTVTNAVGDSLELNNDCGLKYFPAKTTTSYAQVAGMVRARQDDCPPTRTTMTVYETDGTTDMATVTATITPASAPSGFSCPPMTVTNAMGDELTMDENCGLQYSPTGPLGASRPNAARKIDVFAVIFCVISGGVFALLAGLSV